MFGGSVVAPPAEALAPVLTRLLTRVLAFVALRPLAAILAVAALVVARLVICPILALVVLTLVVLTLRILALSVLTVVILTVATILPVTAVLTVATVLAITPLLTLATRLIRLRRRIRLLVIGSGAEIRLRRAIVLDRRRPIAEAAVVCSLAVLAIVVEGSRQGAVCLLELRLCSRDDPIIMLGVLKVVLSGHGIAGGLRVTR
jgi:hypothetical protein